jgi:hypothetical protein
MTTKILAQVNIRDYFFGHQQNAEDLASSPGAFISALLPNIMMVAGIIFFFLIVGAGFSLIVGAGGQKSPQEAAKAKATLTTGVIGFLLVIGAYFILQMVSTMLGVNLLTPPNL